MLTDLQLCSDSRTYLQSLEDAGYNLNFNYELLNSGC
jgi:hypothetical protein